MTGSTYWPFTIFTVLRHMVAFNSSIFSINEYSNNVNTAPRIMSVSNSFPLFFYCFIDLLFAPLESHRASPLLLRRFLTPLRITSISCLCLLPPPAKIWVFSIAHFPELCSWFRGDLNHEPHPTEVVQAQLAVLLAAPWPQSWSQHYSWHHGEP